MIRNLLATFGFVFIVFGVLSAGGSPILDLSDNQGSSINNDTEMPPAATMSTATIDGDRLLIVEISRMPPEYQAQSYGIWVGCNLQHKFTNTGTYVVELGKKTNVKLVRLGDYQLYGYHDFAPDSEDECPPPSVHNGGDSQKVTEQ